MKVWKRTRQTSHLFQVSSSSVSGYMSTCLTSAIRSFYMHTFLTKWCWSGLTVLSRHSVETLSEKWAGIQLVRNTRPQSSQLAVPLFTDPGPKKGISALANLQFKKKNSRKIIHRILPQILACEEKGTTTITIINGIDAICFGQTYFYCALSPLRVIFAEHLCMS